MPFVSEAQRRFLFANHPDVAERWAHDTPEDVKLPEHVEKKAYENAFFDELGKIAMDPVSMAGGLAMGKIMATNALSRHAMKLPPFRRLVQEIAGVGFRTAQQGKPMLSRPLREMMAVGIDPKLTGLYEAAHGAGQHLSGAGATGALRDMAQQAGRNIPEVASHAKFLDGIPTQSTGWRKALDYSFSPVSQVAGDAKGLFGRIADHVKKPFAAATSG